MKRQLFLLFLFAILFSEVVLADVVKPALVEINVVDTNKYNAVEVDLMKPGELFS